MLYSNLEESLDRVSLCSTWMVHLDEIPVCVMSFFLLPVRIYLRIFRFRLVLLKRRKIVRYGGSYGRGYDEHKDWRKQIHNQL